MDYSAKDIFKSANNFHVAAITLFEKLDETKDVGTYLAPNITVSSFTLELYLKCIYMLENKRAAPNMHALDKLFDLLSIESKHIIEYVYNSLVQRSPSIQELKRIFLEKDLRLESVIKEMSHAFVKWRYSYEKKQLPDYTGASEIIEGLKARIRMLEPEWFDEEEKSL
ncbi:hypothetical protein [Cytobacillus firmus]|uniref:hypothetical protein n=1 Tax=Cytobacillus firmus TaxID=1399 RepID=UPI0018CEB187|nr:hypothetical protein [Cytobacillus firmus]MBG9585560.1 hypothetical protein [Cytobacillus firmus]MBG9585615.1 hypothetical protein [Cytobacillus firmus]MBG9586924.1 hypothetical protein [Cytobacillus firmus]MBG9587418.1 hypothetical protein [Cytobacillus firmus]